MLDTAVAGRAHILATYNFADFQTPNTEVLEPGRLLTYRTAHHSVLIADAHRVADFLRTGQFPTPTPLAGATVPHNCGGHGYL